MILAVKTDNPEAKLYLYKGAVLISSFSWLAHRELSTTLLMQINQFLSENQATRHDLSALMVYSGPGSFTGLRIGVSVMNSLAYSLSIPIVGIGGDEWIQKALKLLVSKNTGGYVIPNYGTQAHITKPRK